MDLKDMNVMELLGDLHASGVCKEMARALQGCLHGVDPCLDRSGYKLLVDVLLLKDLAQQGSEKEFQLGALRSALCSSSLVEEHLALPCFLSSGPGWLPVESILQSRAGSYYGRGGQPAAFQMLLVTNSPKTRQVHLCSGMMERVVLVPPKAPDCCYLLTVVGKIVVGIDIHREDP